MFAQAAAARDVEKTGSNYARAQLISPKLDGVYPVLIGPFHGVQHSQARSRPLLPNSLATSRSVQSAQDGRSLHVELLGEALSF